MHLGVGGWGGGVGVLICVLKSQINEHDKLLLLALALPQAAKWHCLSTLVESYSESLLGPPNPPRAPTLSLPWTWDSPCKTCQSQWEGEMGEVTVHGVQGHSGRSKGVTVQVNRVVPSAQVQLSATAVRPTADSPGGGNGDGGNGNGDGGGGGILSCPHLSSLFEAL